jgi:uncharacterized protein (DUF58 family)
MRLALATRSRSKEALKAPSTDDPSDLGAYVSLDGLAGLEASARDFGFAHRQPVHSVLSGRHGSRIRGRGLSFEELRPYQAGDDIRTMDWRVTARARKPYVRVCSEEKDRPTLVVVDQRINMFFGSVRSTKSVVAAEAAALTAWRCLGQGDRVGGIVFGDAGTDEIRPHRSRMAVQRLTRSIVARNRSLRAVAPAVRTPQRLNEVLAQAAQLAARDHLVVLISDFDGHDDTTQRHLLRLAAANEVIAMLVYDPFLLKLPPSGDLVVGDGELQVVLALSIQTTRRSLTDFADERARDILDWRRRTGVTVLPISAAEEAAPQLRRLLGHTRSEMGGR